MKRFVETIGYITGILSIIGGIIAVIVGFRMMAIVSQSELVKEMWIFIFLGVLFILSGIFWCGLMWYISQHDDRLERVEKHLCLPVYEEAVKQEKYYKDSNGLWQVVASDETEASSIDEEKDE